MYDSAVFMRRIVRMSTNDSRICKKISSVTLLTMSQSFKSAALTSNISDETGKMLTSFNFAERQTLRIACKWCACLCE